ncbi:MAG TPA: hypothetical protein PLD73_15630 [Candidatus Hydrogenedentes bacterium]|nr:hypothetical protein [Candidatus Hydrogenedentota bacterium]
MRRLLLERLYERYMRDPLGSLTPSELLDNTTVDRENLIPNIHYLHDRGLVELMMGFSAPMFDGARITANGIDLVENTAEFGLRFPRQLDDEEALSAEVPILMERLVEEAELSALDGEARRALLRDIQYLRDELARPLHRWRLPVIAAVLDWIDGHFTSSDECLPSFERFRTLIRIHRTREG